MRYCLAVLILTFGFGAVQAAPPLLFPEQSQRIALDPGHGGRDNGSSGPTGHLEKDVSLELARSLTLKLEPQYAVTLTRSDDYDVDLRQRAAIANQARSSLLISIHTGAAFLHAAQGVTIYFYSSNKSSIQGEAMVNDSEAAATWNGVQLRHRAASINLAGVLKYHLDQIPGIAECKIQGAPLVALEGADMPAVLVEIGHITHPSTEKDLSSAAYIDRMAVALNKGIVLFLGEQARQSKP